MPIVKGPFTVKWGENVLKDVEEVDVSFEQESNDYTTIDGRTTKVFGAISASATITLLSSDVKSLSILLPQFTKTEDDEMSTGEIVAKDAVALDVLAGDCTVAQPEAADLDIIACGNPAEVFRIKETRTSISEFSLENNQVRTIQITFTGEPVQGHAAVQAFIDGTLLPNPES